MSAPTGDPLAVMLCPHVCPYGSSSCRNGDCSGKADRAAADLRVAFADGSLTPEDLGMSPVAGKDHRGSERWSPHRYYDCADDPCRCSRLYCLPSKEVTDG